MRLPRTDWSILAKKVELKEIVDVRSIFVSSCGNVPSAGITFITSLRMNLSGESLELNLVSSQFPSPNGSSSPNGSYPTR